MDKKNKILETAIKLLVKQGIENTPTSQIAKDAKCATGTLFHHYKSKEDLINAAYLYVKQKMIAALEINREASIKQQLQTSWSNTFDYGKKNSTDVKFMIMFSGSAYITETTKQKGKKIFEPFTNILFQGKKQGIFKDFPQETLEAIYFSICQIIFNTKNLNKSTIDLGFLVVWDALKK